MICRNDCIHRDGQDPLREIRQQFVLPPGIIYLDGNSLGPLPKAVPERIEQVVRQEWGVGLIRSWNSVGWVDLPQKVGAKIAPLIGAQANEVIAADSTSINLFKCLCMALSLRPERKAVVSEQSNFPTDLYMVEGVRQFLGRDFELRLMDGDQIEAALSDDVAVLMLTEVDFKTGRLHDMRRLTEKAHAKGILTIWDLAHSTGALPVDLAAAEADFAVGCGYKYLNGGPGAPAFIFVKAELQSQTRSPLTGWFGHANPFDFTTAYKPAPDIRRQLCGTPAVIGLSALDAALDIFNGVSMSMVRTKSLALSDLFMALLAERLENEFDIVTPQDPAQRGSQVSLMHPHGYAIVQALIERGIIGDFRAPNILRFGLASLYLRFVDIFDAIEGVSAVMKERSYLTPRYAMRAAVT